MTFYRCGRRISKWSSWRTRICWAVLFLTTVETCLIRGAHSSRSRMPSAEAGVFSCDLTRAPVNDPEIPASTGRGARIALRKRIVRPEGACAGVSSMQNAPSEATPRGCVMSYWKGGPAVFVCPRRPGGGCTIECRRASNAITWPRSSSRVIIGRPSFCDFPPHQDEEPSS